MRVNIVTKDLFAQYPEPESMAAAPVKKLETIIHSTGFFRNKAKNIKGCAARIVEMYREAARHETESRPRPPVEATEPVPPFLVNSN